MVEVKCAVGHRIYSIKCSEHDAKKVTDLASQLNQCVNRNALLHRSLSNDNLFFITALEILDRANSQGKSSTISKSNTTSHSSEMSEELATYFSSILTNIIAKVDSIVADISTNTKDTTIFKDSETAELFSCHQ